MTGYFVSDALFDAGMWESAFPPRLRHRVADLGAVVVSDGGDDRAHRLSPDARRPRLIPLITSIGMSFFIQYAVRGLVGESFLTLPLLPQGLQDRISILGLDVEGIKLFVIVTAVVSMVGLWFFVNRSKTGRAIRAVSEDKEIAGLMGIDVNRVIVTTFAVGVLWPASPEPCGQCCSARSSFSPDSSPGSRRSRLRSSAASATSSAPCSVG